MSQYRLLGTAETAQEVAAALNIRRQELQLTLADLDEILGFAPRYASKIFAPNYRKSLGALSLPAFLQGLGCKLVIVADDSPEALPAITQRAIRERTVGAGVVGRNKQQVAA